MTPAVRQFMLHGGLCPNCHAFRITGASARLHFKECEG